MNYAGIGSRNTPNEVLLLMESLGEWLAKKGHTLRSGGAEGADFAFEKGCDKAKGKKEIYLPWNAFNNRKASKNVFCLYENAKEAFALAEKYHPNWEYLTAGGKALMARDGYQVLGIDLQTPADFIVCYTEGGLMKGGTGQALRIARDYGIPIFNMGRYQSKEEIYQAFNVFYKDLLEKEKQEIEYE